MKNHGWFVLFLLFCPPIAAQTAAPTLMAQGNGRSIPVGLTKVDASVRIFGSVATATITMTFTNRMRGIMEGILCFPLPEGAAISGYALDIRSMMVEGVAVEKHEARRVFEDVVRRGIDPGLAEWAKGNNFQARVFPIPASGSRTVRVEYISELIGGKDTPAYYLPLRFSNKLDEFSLRVEIVKPAAPPRVTKGGLANFAFAEWRDSYVAETKQKHWASLEDLIIALPKTQQPEVIVEKDDDGQIYFAIHDYPIRPTAGLQVAAVKHVVVFWDASGSRLGDHRREIILLQNYLGQLLCAKASGKPPKLTVDLMLLRNAVSTPVRIEFSKSTASMLAAELDKVQYDGGTQLGAIGPVPRAKKPGLYLLFTDGISTFGRDMPPQLNAPLYIFSVAPGTNHALLHSLATANGGQYFNLSNWSDADVVARAGRSAWSFLSASIEGGTPNDLYPQRPYPIAGRFTLVGKLANQTAKVTLNCGIQGSVVWSRTFTVLRSDAVKGSLLRHLWAQKKLAELMIHQDRNKNDIAKLGKQFGLVTPYTSLLVLDSLEQYVTYEVAPPKSLATMHQEYVQRIGARTRQKAEQETDKMAAVVRMWEERVKWWDTKFRYPRGFKYRTAESREARPNMIAWAADAILERLAAAFSPAPRYLVLHSAPFHLTEAAAPANQSVTPGQSVMELCSTGREQELTKQLGRPHVIIKPWNPSTPYLRELRAAKDHRDRLAVYFKNRTDYRTSPAFFLDCADFFREPGDAGLTLQILSNVAELEVEDAALLRVLAHQLLQIGQLDLAIDTFERILKLRPEEPQSYRDLALTLARAADTMRKDGTGSPEAIRQNYTRAIDLLMRIILGRWDARFPEIEVVALEEVNHIIPRAKASGLSVIPFDQRLTKLLDVDLRIVMTWYADNSDIDLWVTEPSGEKAFYAHNRTTIGGLLSRDFTQGYGPEEYIIRKAATGSYKVEANYFGQRATRLLGPITVQVDVFSNYGRPNERRRSVTIRLKEARETIHVGQIEF
jgi:Ca-activated chloride channel homolog